MQIITRLIQTQQGVKKSLEEFIIFQRFIDEVVRNFFQIFRKIFPLIFVSGCESTTNLFLLFVTLML